MNHNNEIIWKKRTWSEIKSKITDITPLNYTISKKGVIRVFIRDSNTRFFCNLYPLNFGKVIGQTPTNDSDYNDFISNYKAGIDNLTPAEENPVKGTSELLMTWSQIKSFYNSNTVSSFLNYADLEDYYYIWLNFRDQKMYLPKLVKGTSDALDFENNYKSLCNIAEALRTRITTNRFGRKLHSRYVTFVTSRQDRFDNTDWQENVYGDLTYIMKDLNGDTTTDPTLAKETWLEWEPPFDYEVSGGYMRVPTDLSFRQFTISSITQSGNSATGTASGHSLRKNSIITILGADQSDYNGQQIITGVNGNNFFFDIQNNPTSPATGTLTAKEEDDAWEIHVIGVPDIPAAFGGSVHFIANPRVKWMKDQVLDIDASLNPAELKYNPTYHTNKLRFIIKHPVGAQTEFQLNLKVFK